MKTMSCCIMVLELSFCGLWSKNEREREEFIRSDERLLGSRKASYARLSLQNGQSDLQDSDRGQGIVRGSQIGPL